MAAAARSARHTDALNAHGSKCNPGRASVGRRTCSTVLPGHRQNLAQIHAQVIRVTDISPERFFGTFLDRFSRDMKTTNHVLDVFFIRIGQSGDLPDNEVERTQHMDSHQVRANRYRRFGYWPCSFQVASPCGALTVPEFSPYTASVAEPTRGRNGTCHCRVEFQSGAMPPRRASGKRSLGLRCPAEIGQRGLSAARQDEHARYARRPPIPGHAGA